MLTEYEWVVYREEPSGSKEVLKTVQHIEDARFIIDLDSQTYDRNDVYTYYVEIAEVAKVNVQNTEYFTFRNHSLSDLIFLRLP